MIQTDLEILLSDQYNVGKYINLNALDQEHYSVLYSEFKDVKQEVFPDNFRIVCYYLSPLTRSFDDCPCDIIEHLQKILAYYDIPNFFVLVVTNDTSIAEDLIYVQKRHSTDKYPISHMIIAK